MKKLILALLVVGVVQISTQEPQQYLPTVYDSRCYVNRDITHEYRTAVYNYIPKLFKSVAIRSNLKFVFSPHSIWMILAAIAEGADPRTQQKLFQILNVPNDPCIRQAYYQLATTRALPSNDVNIKSTRVLLIDDGTTLNPTWYYSVARSSLLDVVRAPIRYNPVATAYEIKRIMSSSLPSLNLNGNSVLLDKMDYNGLWTTAFADAVIERAPFYNIQREVIGAVDMMRVRRKVRMSYYKKLNAKIIELPIGSDERYRMLFSVTIGNNKLTSVVAAFTTDDVFEAIESLRSCYVSINVAIPRVVISSDIDMRVILGDLGVNELLNDPAVTRFISNPPAFPTSFVQRSTVVLNSTGLEYAPSEPEAGYSTCSGLDPTVGRDFIADQPFFFSLFDAETFTCLMAGAFTEPTYM